MHRSIAFIAALLVASGLSAAVANAQTQPTLHVELDATRAASKLYSVKETISGLAPGPFTFVYPQWIPGYHQAVGPIEGVVAMYVRAGGATLPWRRDLVDMYAIHTTVPAGASSVEIDFDVVGAPSRQGMSEPFSDSEAALVEFSNFVVYPQGSHAEDISADASIRFPHGWTYGTALPVASHDGDVVRFKPAMLYTLIDSPIAAGMHEREYDLGPTEFLDVSSDSARGAAVTPKFLTGMRHLVQEAPAFYGGRHYRDYHFLLTVSDAAGFDGIEHHESSDDRAPENYANDDTQYVLAADLLPHEYSHSWNGKYRRPGDLATPDYQQPEKTDLLWVYEGLNQYAGELLATRARLENVAQERDTLAETAGSMDIELGRRWRPIRDTADAAPFLYGAPEQYYNIRRNAGDFYAEGSLIWLDADVTIRRLTGGTKSLDDFAKLWGNGSNTTQAPVFVPYDRAFVEATLARVVPYDWHGFFTNRIDDVSTHAPLGGITGGGYRLIYTSQPNVMQKRQDDDRKIVDARYSLGVTVSLKDGRVVDSLLDAPAFAAGIAPDDRILALDGRSFSGDTFGDRLNEALTANAEGGSPLQFVVSDGDAVRTVSVDARGGPKYPHLERVPGTPDVLETIFAPKTFKAAEPARASVSSTD